MSTLLAFLVVSAVVIVTPGQDTALLIKNTLAGGRGGGIATSLGIVAGLVVWVLATSAGLAALVVASERVFLILKLVGALYLVYLGLRSLQQALRGRTEEGVLRPAGGLLPLVAFRQGLVTNLGNPKIAVFFTSLLPQFVPDGTFLPILGLGLLFCAMGLAWLTAYALLVARASDHLRGTSVRRALDAITGAVLVALGLRLATDRR
ncbi:MAG: LysE family translocator [Actinobacteria bacterium]|nr:LysE family translocator [Actinomycetota bacterium]